MRPEHIAAMMAEVKAGWITPQIMELLRQMSDSLVETSVLPLRSTLRALRAFTPGETRVIILGQDPYPSPGKANGLAFGIAPEYEGRRDYSSFGNILAELRACGCRIPTETKDVSRQWATLEHWAAQGVLLLNTRLSVKPGAPMSHAGCGWESVVPRILAQALAAAPEAVWLCWGAEARTTAIRLGVPEFSRIALSHPTKYSASRGSHLAPAFLGSKWPTRVNRILKNRGLSMIDWAGAEGVPSATEEG